MNARITVREIACRLNVGRQTVYAMLEGGILPGMRFGERWLITRHAYEKWERTCGTQAPTDLAPGLRAYTELGS